jgi:hypothetical protein
MLNFVKYSLQELFAVRPTWSKKQLMDLCVAYFEWHYPSSNEAKIAAQDLVHTITGSIKTVLPSIAFLYTSGPWRNLYVKYQYNPSNPDPKSHGDGLPCVLQTITVKISLQEYNKLLQKLRDFIFFFIFA